MWLLSVVATVFFVFALFPSGGRAGGPCSYDGNMCNISSNDCLLPMLKQDMLYTCPHMSYSELYATRGEKNIFIKVSNSRKYAKNLTFAVACYVKGNLTAVRGCCSLRPDSPCPLPTRKPGETYYIFAPYIDKRSFCKRTIQEKPGVYPEWCEKRDTPPCIFLENGIITVKEKFTYLRIAPLQIPTDFCFFEAPVKYSKNGRTGKDGLFLDIEGIGITAKQSIVHIDGREIRCKLIPNQVLFNLTAHMQSNRPRIGQSLCAFYRMKRYSKEWSERPLCAHNIKPTPRLEIASYEEHDARLLFLGGVIALLASATTIFMVTWRPFQRRWPAAKKASFSQERLLSGNVQTSTLLKSSSEKRTATVTFGSLETV